MKILIADDHDLFRDGLSQLLQSVIDCQIINANCYIEAKKQCDKEKDFSLILLDLHMPGANGVEGILDLRKTLPDAYIVVISGIESCDITSHLLDSGIQGYIPKSSSSDIILNAIQLVLSGGIYIPPMILSLLSSPKVKTVDIENTHALNQDMYTLTNREHEVLALLVKGHSNKAIARDLSIAATTVRTHTVSIFRTLNVSNRTQAGHLAIELGLV